MSDVPSWSPRKTERTGAVGIERCRTINEVAELCSLCRSTVKNAIARGEIQPTLKFGRTRRIPESALMRYLRSKVV